MFYDFICTNHVEKNNKNAYYYIRATWLEAVEKRLLADTKDWYICSDCCGGQFKNVYHLHLLASIAEKLSITIHCCFYCARHGHNQCDSHKSVVQNYINQFQQTYQSNRAKQNPVESNSNYYRLE